MRIGIDLDNTICDTSGIIHELGKEYAKKNNIDYNELFSNKELKDKFFIEKTLDVFTNSKFKPNAIEVLQRLKKDGHELYVITARSNHFTSKIIDVYEPTINWLKDNNIEIDKLIIDSYGKKASVCLENKIDIMIDDDIDNCEEIKNVGIKCLLFDDNGYYSEEDKVTNWLDIEKIIKGELK